MSEKKPVQIKGLPAEETVRPWARVTGMCLDCYRIGSKCPHLSQRDFGDYCANWDDDDDDFMWDLAHHLDQNVTELGIKVLRIGTLIVIRVMVM